MYIWFIEDMIDRAMRDFSLSRESAVAHFAIFWPVLGAFTALFAILLPLDRYSVFLLAGDASWRAILLTAAWIFAAIGPLFLVSRPKRALQPRNQGFRVKR